MGLGAAPGQRRRILVLVVGLGLFGAALLVTYRDSVVGALRERVRISGVAGWREEILVAADESRVDPHLIAGVMFMESGGRVDVVSSVDALGLMQLKLATARERARRLGLAEPSRAELLSDGALNVRLGAAYLRYLIDRFGGDPEAALVAYNGGPTRLAGRIEEYGSYAAWRAKQVRDGDSLVLSYAQSARRYADIFRRRALFDDPSRPDAGP